MSQENLKPSVLLVDGYSLIYRGFHALPLLDTDGMYTNAVVGFFSMLFRALSEYRPGSLCVMLDVHAPTFRHTLYEEYKATRKPMPEELRPQIPVIRELLHAMGVAQFEMEGYEADDLLGTAARLAEEQGRSAYILTGDRDSLQLVHGDIRVILTKTGISESVLLDQHNVLELYGYTPAQAVDIKALMGDSSDNIPGIHGVGEKTALKLIQEYGTLDHVLAHGGDIKGKLGEKLRTGREMAELSRELGTICTAVPLAIDFDLCTWSHLAKGLPLLEQYKLNRLAQSLRSLVGKEIANNPSVAEKPVDRGITRLPQEAHPDDLEGGPPDPPAFPLRSQGAVLSTEALTQVALTAVEHYAGNAEPLAFHLGTREATLCLSDGRLWHVPLMRDLTLGGLYEDQVLQTLRPAVEDIPFLVHGAKALYGKLARCGLPLPEVRQDTMIGAYLLHPSQAGFALKNCLPPPSQPGDFPDSPEGSASENPEGNAYDIYILSLRQRARLEQKGMLGLLEGMELPLTKVLYEMEREGFGMDVSTLDELGRQFSGEIEALRQDVFRLTGGIEFNLNSPKQLGEVLFDRLGLPAGKKGKAGAYSTDASVLERLSDLHPSVGPLLRYRKLSKLQSTYIEGLRKLVGKTGRVHTTFDQTAAVTGRISSLEPNLQNIPVRSEEGREIRKAFVAREGFLLLDADYSQIELRVLAHLSEDPAMRDAFIKGQDIHTRTAAELGGVTLNEVTDRMRSSAKAVNFGIVYGISAFGLARNIGIGRKEAERFIDTYFERYPGVHAFMDRMVKLGYEQGYVETLFHRRRELPELRSKLRNVRSFGERAAMNTPVQGTAADIIKLAMVRVRDEMSSAKFQARLILQVHDELVVECPNAEVEPVSKLIRNAMENVVTLSVPLVAEVSAGKNWFEAH
ncbi:MAG: DNA polymerase I [Clostridia bacterium]|nr:DNA polymerase I [Clostridia bacterium]